MGVQQLDQKHREPADSGPPRKSKIFDKFDTTDLAASARAWAQRFVQGPSLLFDPERLRWAFKNQCHILSQAYRSYRSSTPLTEQILTGAVRTICRPIGRVSG